MAEKSAGSTRTVEGEASEEFEVRAPRWLRPSRDWVRRAPGGALIWKLLISAIGGVIVIVGLLLIPLPGPGWALVFLGVAVWATEFHWAFRLLQFGRRVLRNWTDWAKRQSLLIRLLLGLVGLLVLAGLAWFGWRTLH